MKLTVVGDPHCTPNNIDQIVKLFLEVEELGNTTIWLGDFLHTKEVVRGLCLNLIYRCLKMSQLEHIVLVGNHDYFNLECTDHSLQLLKELPNVKVIDKMEEIDSNMYAIPYIHDQDKLKATIKNIPKGAVLFSHLELKGFDFGNGYMCETGMDEKSFSKFKRVVSGHFHKFQEKGNLTYLGTPFSHSFGESNQEKFLGIYDINTDELEFIPTKFPKHITVDLSVIGEDLVPKALDEFNESNDHIRIINTNSKLKIDKSQYPRIKFVERFNVKKQATKYVVNDTESNDVKFQKWGKSVKKLKPSTLKLGLEILRSV